MSFVLIEPTANCRAIYKLHTEKTAQMCVVLYCALLPTELTPSSDWSMSPACDRLRPGESF